MADYSERAEELEIVIDKANEKENPILMITLSQVFRTMRLLKAIFGGHSNVCERTRKLKEDIGLILIRTELPEIIPN